MQNFTNLELHLLQLTEEIAHLEVSKNKTEQTRIIIDIEHWFARVNPLIISIQTELKRTNLTIQEQFNLDLGIKLAQIFSRDLKEAETKVKAIKTV